MMLIEVIATFTATAILRITLQVAENSTVGDALILAYQKEPVLCSIDWAAIGIFGAVVSRDTILKNHDRIELYRPLSCDPKVVRRQKARHNSYR